MIPKDHGRRGFSEWISMIVKDLVLPAGSGANLGAITSRMPHRDHWSLPAMGGTGVVCPSPRLAGVVCPSPHNPAGMAAETTQKYATEPSCGTKVFVIMESEVRAPRSRPSRWPPKRADR